MSRVVVVGGGVSGLSSAWWLAQAGVEVLVIEAGLVGGEASGRNGGGCTHYASPLFAEEQRLWPQMSDLLGMETEFRPHRIRVALDQRQLDLYARAAGYAVEQGFVAEPLTADDIRELVPWTGEAVHGGFYLRYGGEANPHRTTQGYAWALRRLGGRILQHTRVTGFARTGGRISAVHTTQGPFGCDAVVLAAGPGLIPLARALELDLPLAVARAEMIVTEPLPLLDCGGGGGNLLYGRQSRRGNLLYGGGPHEWTSGLGPKVSTPVATGIARRLAELFPKVGHARVIRTWAGLIENTPDGRPILDRLGNLVVCTMSGVGFGLSPASGRAVQQLVTDGVCSFADLSTLSLARFADLEPDWRALQGWQQAFTGQDAKAGIAYSSRH